jgi:hypothetical protein
MILLVVGRVVSVVVAVVRSCQIAWFSVLTKIDVKVRISRTVTAFSIQFILFAPVRNNYKRKSVRGQSSLVQRTTSRKLHDDDTR